MKYLTIEPVISPERQISLGHLMNGVEHYNALIAAETDKPYVNRAAIRQLMDARKPWLDEYSKVMSMCPIRGILVPA